MSNKKRKLKVGFDFDGVVVDHTKNKILIAKKHGFDISITQAAGHRLKKMVPDNIYVKIQESIYGPLTLSAVPMLEVKESMAELSKIAELFLVSRRSSDHRRFAVDWLNKNLPGIFSPGQIFFVDQDQHKNDLCETLNIAIFIDDKISTLQHMQSLPHRYWFDQYDSSGELNYQGLIVVKSWKEFLTEIKRLSNAQPSNR
jgi:uncharacterized HAD superfamily protein